MFKPQVLLLTALFVLMGLALHAQDEFFHELRLEHELLESEQWALNGEANWKYLYNEPRWRRWGVAFAGVRKLGALRLLGGANGFYTFNRSITNFFELRPWWAAQLNLPLSERLDLRQRLRSEWRFFYNEGDATRENYGRIRYRIGLDIALSGHEESAWTLRPAFEWFFLRNPAQFERFSNERDYSLSLIHELHNGSELHIDYRLEEFFDIEGGTEYGHLILLGYSF